MKKVNLLLLAVLFMVTMVCVSKTAVAEEVGNYPDKWYGWWCPYVDQLPPQGGVIEEVQNQKVIKSWGYKTGNSFEEIKDLMPECFYNEVLANPEIWGNFRFNETAYMPTDAKPWLEATKKYKGESTLDEDGQIRNYKAGCPFPGSTNGLEIAWNVLKRHTTGDNWYGPWAIPIVDKKGQTRWIAGKNIYFFFDGRLSMEPAPIYTPNPHNYDFLQTFGYVAPYEMRGTVPLIYRYNDPKKQDDMWMYLPALRRVRRMSAAQRWDRIPGGADVWWDSFQMFWGKPTNYDWEYKGTKKMLASYNGKWEVQMIKDKLIGGCDNYWQRMDLVVLEGYPKIVSPLSKMILYLDPVEYAPLWSVFLDKKGRPWVVYFYGISWDKRWMRDQPNMIMFDIQRKHSSNTFLKDTGHDIDLVTPDFLTMESLKKYFGGR